MPCVICNNKISFPYLPFSSYNFCPYCNFYFQKELPPKILEGPDENNGLGPGTGHLMSDQEKEINKNLANALYGMFVPRTVLDLGCKYPYFLSVLKDKIEVLGIDPISGILEYGQKLGVPVIQSDFEDMDITPYKNKYDLITLIHVFEHFYNPLNTIKKVVECLTHRGVIYIRIPNIDVKGIERDFTDHHVQIHPFIYSTQAMYLIAEKIGCEIFRIDHIEGFGQSDFYLRKKKRHLSLSVCMIVKNEEKNVTDCLESIKNVADEIIVVDTGSIDKTKEVVGKYTHHIFDFQWIDDFSAARNYSLSKATGDAIIWLDADDIVENPEDIKPLLKEEEFKIFNLNIKYGNEIFSQARLFRNFYNIKFAGRVHEYPIIDNLKIKDTNVNIIHKTEKHVTENRSERNLRILEKEVVNDPNNPRSLFYLANAYKELTRWDKAIDTYRKYLAISTWRDERWMAQKNIGCILLWNKKYIEAIEELKGAIEIDDRWAESYYYIAESYYYLQKPEECVKWALKATEKEMPVSPLWKEVPIYKEAPYRYLFASYGSLGKYDKALHYCKIASEKAPEDQWLKDRIVYFENLSKGTPIVIECYRWGALGDCLMTTASLRALKQKIPGCYIRFITHPKMFPILEGNKYIDELVSKSKSEESEKIYFSYPDKNSPIRDEGYPDKPLNRHIVNIFAECAGLRDEIDLKMECTLTEEEEKAGQYLKSLYKKYVTLHMTSGWSEYKDWYNDRWGIVIEELFKKGYVTIQLGHESDPLLAGTVDYRGHTIKEAISAIKYADFHMGVDSFTNHASAVVGTRAIILFGSTSPIGSGYDQNVNIYKNLSCQPCYREYEWSKDSKGPCPHGKKCMDLIKINDVLEMAYLFINR